MVALPAPAAMESEPVERTRAAPAPSRTVLPGWVIAPEVSKTLVPAPASTVLTPPTWL